MELENSTEVVPMGKEIQVSFKEIQKLRDEQELSFQAIAKKVGANVQSVMACYEEETDRVYRPRAVVRAPGKRGPGRPKKNGNGHKAANGNGHKTKPGRPAKAAATPATDPELQRFTDTLIAELRARGIWFLRIDLKIPEATVKFEREQKIVVRA
jgi:hypothetical protein